MNVLLQRWASGLSAGDKLERSRVKSPLAHIRSRRVWQRAASRCRSHVLGTIVHVSPVPHERIGGCSWCDLLKRIASSHTGRLLSYEKNERALQLSQWASLSFEISSKGTAA